MYVFGESISDIKNTTGSDKELMHRESHASDVQKMDNTGKLENQWATITWWNCYKKKIPSDQLLIKMNERVAKLEDDMRPYYQKARVYNYLYLKRDHGTDYVQRFNEFLTGEQILHNLSFNIGQVAIDAHYNNIMKNTPKIKLQTKEAKNDIIREASQLERYLNNSHKKGGLNKIGPTCSKSGMVSSISHVKLHLDKKNKSFKHTRVSAYDFLVEKPFEGSSKRDEFIEKKRISLWQLRDFIESFDDEEKRNELLKEYEEKYKDTDENTFILIYEAYKAGCCKIIFTQDMLLLKTDWSYMFVPYAKFVWEEPETGYIPIGLIETTMDCQEVVNWILFVILQNADLYKANQLCLPQGSEYANAITNEFADIIEYDPSEGGRPFQLSPNIINEQWFKFLETVFLMGLKKARVSEVQQDASVPSNIRSATGLQTLQNIDSSRFVANKTRYQETFIEIAKMEIKMGIKEYASDFSFFEFAKENEEELYHYLTFFSGSLLEDVPQAKITMAQDLFNAEKINLEQFATMLKISPEELPNIITGRSKRRMAIAKRIEEALKDENKSLVFDDYLGVNQQEEVALKFYDDIMTESEEGEEDNRLVKLRAYLLELKNKKEEQIQNMERKIEAEMQYQQMQKLKQKRLGKVI